MGSGGDARCGATPSNKTASQPPSVRVIAMPADANPNSDIFGGWLLSQMDLAGGQPGGAASPWPQSDGSG